MKINILNDFSYTPGPRYIKEGDFSGESFRQDILSSKIKQAISEDVVLTVEVDGTAGFGRSFFEESFGGLIRIEKIPYEDIVKHLEIISVEEPEWIEKIQGYLKAANEKSA